MRNRSSRTRLKMEGNRILNRFTRTNRFDGFVPEFIQSQQNALRQSIILMLILGLGAFAWWLVFKSPELYVSTVERLHRQQLPVKDYLDAINAMRATALSLVTGFGLFIGAYLTLRNVAAAEKNVKLAQEGQITDRFSKAVEQLGSDKIAMRLGGIYALERIAKDSERDHWPVMEILTAFVRENSPLSETTKLALLSSATSNGSIAIPKVLEDINAIMTVIRRRNWQCETSGQYLDLSNTYLGGVDLSGAYLKKAKFIGAYLGHAQMIKVDFESANLQNCDLSHANLQRAFLQDANIEHGVLVETDLMGATLSQTDLMFARIENCCMTEAKMDEACFRKSSISGADIGRSDLQYANFIQAELNDVSFHKSHLEWAKFGGARLTDTDISKAYCEGIDHTEFTTVTTQSQSMIVPAATINSPVTIQTPDQLQILLK